MNRQDKSSKMLTGYCAYLVRLWQDSPYAEWRAAAQSVQTREIVRFADLEQLFTFLRAQTTTQPVENKQGPSQAGTKQETSTE